MNRIALITQSAPWERNPLHGSYNWQQAAAVKRNGGEMELFVPVTSAPRVVQRFSARLRAVNARPDDYEYQGVRIHAFKGYTPHPAFARWKLSSWMPGLLGKWYATLEPRIAQAIKPFRPDVVLVHDGLLMGDLAQRVGQRVGVPYAIIEHETIDFDPATRRGRYYRQITDSAKAIFIAHEASLAQLRDKLGLSQAKLLLNGSVTATPQQLATARPAKWEGKKVVLSVGAFDPAKGHVELIKAFAEAGIDNSILVIVGSGVMREAILATIDQADLKDRAEVLEPMPQEQLQQYMAWADLFALPSRWESFGLVFTEAMGAQTPVICTSQCGIASHLTPGVHGWIVPPGDHGALVGALREALTSADLETMGRVGRQLVQEKFSWDNNARQLLMELR